MGRSNVGALRGPGRSLRENPRGAPGAAGGFPAAALACADTVRTALSLEALPLNLLAFLIGRATVLQVISPFALAFFTAILALAPRRAVGAALAAAGGILSCGSVAGCVEFAGAAVGLGLLLASFDPRAKARGWVTLGALAFTVTVVAGCTKAFLVDPTPYRFLMAFFAGLLTFVLTLVYLAALPPLLSVRRPLVLGSEQVIAGAITAATALAGLSGLGYAGVTLSGVAAGVLVLAAATVCGGGVGAAVGTVVGVVAALCGAGGLSMVGLRALSGLLAGSFRAFGKLGAASGYFLGTLLLSPLVEEAAHLRAAVLEAAVAAAVLVVIPPAVLEPIGAALGRPAAGQAAGEGDAATRERIGRRLADFGLVFSQLAATLKETSAAAPAPAVVAPGTGETSAALSGLAEAACRVCQSCRLHRSCWKGDQERTRGAMAGLLEVTAERGQLEARDVPTQIRRRCIHLGELVTTMNFLHEVSVLNRHWRKKLDETRGVVHQQLEGLAMALRALGEGLEAEAGGDAELAEELVRQLDRAGFPVREVIALRVPDGRTEFLVTADACEGGDLCRELAAPVASTASGETLVLADMSCGLAAGRADCSFRLSLPRRMDYKIGVAQVRKSPGGVSGDSYMIRELPGNRLAAVLSDGTGAGPRAAEESRTTVKMLEELFKLGFDTETTVKTVNSMLLLRSAYERFATLDLLTVDLYDGQARFVKVGAPPSYVKQGREVWAVHSANLPLGVLPEVSAEGHVRTLRSGDLVVLATDGLIAAAADRAGTPEDNWITDFLRDMGEATPQEVADALVEAAVSLSGRRLPAVAGGASGLLGAGGFAGPGGVASGAGAGGYRGLRDDVTVVTLRFGPPEGA